MKRELFVYLSTLWILTQTAAAADLRSKEIFNTGSFVCDGTVKIAQWTNSMGQTLYIKKARIWLGMLVDRQADYSAEVYRIPEFSPLVGFAWDHYANPTGLHQVTETFEPDYFLLLPGQKLQLNYFCLGFGAYKDQEGHVTVTIWYTDLAP